MPEPRAHTVVCMDLANTIISATGDLLVLISVLILVWTLKAVNGARTDAQTAEQAASKARKEAADRQIVAQQEAEQATRAADQRARDAVARDRQAAERAADWQREMALERRRERVEKIGELVEDIFWTLAPPGGGDGAGQDLAYQHWMPVRNQIGHLLVGLSKDLPECANLLNDATASSALGHARLAREEVRLELERIDGALYLIRNPQYYTEAAGGQLLAGKRVVP
jgi:hypothetical protein